MVGATVQSGCDEDGGPGGRWWPITRGGGEKFFTLSEKEFLFAQNQLKLPNKANTLTVSHIWGGVTRGEWTD